MRRMRITAAPALVGVGLAAAACGGAAAASKASRPCPNVSQIPIVVQATHCQ
jgi:ABC-type glycerol-3-phosphate transport system substrate-binding protein